jgi:UDP:flavonoid glycosyltransferase YjiC (YdhE family)
MTKYIFLNMPAYGHVNPTLAVAHELVNRGQNVIYYLLTNSVPTAPLHLT